MSKHERQMLIHHMDGAVDSLFCILDGELLTHDEIYQLGQIQEELKSVADKCSTLIRQIEIRKQTNTAVPIQRTYTGPAFSWNRHEERIKRKKMINKLRSLEAQITNLELRLEEQDDE